MERGAPSEGRPTSVERKLVTLLFADIVDSTSLGEQLDPERWRSLLQRYFSTASATIEDWGGTVQKFAGDAIMAVFGVPLVREDDAQRALHAGLEMVERLEDLNAEFRRHHGVTLAIRVGVNTGEVVVAPDQLIATGDAVNVAARLQQLADPDTVLAGERTCVSAGSAFEFGDAESREVKGKTGAVGVRRVLRAKVAAVDRRSGLKVRMVGREPEIGALDALLEKAIASRRPHLALVYGQAGIGKSRLVREFINLAGARHQALHVVSGRCPAAGHGITYWALGEMVRAECGIALDDSVPVARARLHARIADVLGPSEELDRTIYAMAVTAGINLPDNPLDQIRPVAVANELSIAWSHYVSALAGHAPTVLFVEDLHWAGDQLLAMIERLVDYVTGPLTLVATARPEFAESHPGFASGRRTVDVVPIERLTEADSSTLIKEFLDGGRIPEAYAEQLIATTGGNPFFLEEVLRRLIDIGALTRAGDHWEASASLTSVVLPDTVQGVIAARVDALPAVEKRALQEASVIGRIFWADPVGVATGDLHIIQTLFRLQDRDLVTVRPRSTIGDQTEFIFKHALVRDVAYASVSHARRAQAHDGVGRWLEEVAGERSDELSELIAYHYRSAIAGEDADLAWLQHPDRRDDVRRRAIEWLLKAGASARQRYAIAKALELNNAALGLATDDRERAAALEAIGDANEGGFHGDDAVPAWRSALSLLATQPDSAAARARIALKCAKMTGIRWGGFKVVPPVDEVDGFIDEGLSSNPDPLSSAWLFGLRAYAGSRDAATHRSDKRPIEERVAAGERGLALARELGDVDLQVLTNRALSGLAVLSADYDRALQFTRQEMGLVDRITATRDRALSLFFLALRLMDFEGRFEEGVDLARRSHALGKELSPHEVMHATSTLIYGNALLGRWADVEIDLEEHLVALKSELDMSCPYARMGPFIGAAVLAHQGNRARAREILDSVPLRDESPALPEAYAGLARLALGDVAAARELADRVLATEREATQEEALVEVLLKLDVLVDTHDGEGVVAFLPRARQTQKGLAILEPAADRAEAVATAEQGDEQEARRLLLRAIDQYQRLAIPYEVARTKELLSSLQTPESSDLIREATAIYRRLGASADLDRLARVASGSHL